MAPPRGAEAEAVPGQADGVPRDHRARRSRTRSTNPRELDMKLVEAQEGRRVLDRLVGLRGLAGALAPGRRRPLGRPRAERRDPARRRARARADGVPRRRATGTSTAGSPRAASTSARGSSSSTASASRRAATSTPPPARSTPDPTSVHLARGRRASRSPGASPTPRSRSRRRSRSRSPNGRRHRSRPRRCSRRPGTSSASAPARTMSVAQGLYERGYITYMRTDSVQLSQQAVDAARAQIVERFGQATTSRRQPRTYANKVKNAQEAHEAIRPAGAQFRTPEQVRERAQPRRAGALRADLDAHGREPDDRRPGPHAHVAPRRRRRARASRRSSGRRAAPTSSSASAWPTST